MAAAGMSRDRRSLIAAVTALQGELQAVTAQLVDQSPFTAPAALDDFVGHEGPTYASCANALLTARRRLCAALKIPYSVDPGFDILLDVFVREETGVAATFATCCAAGRVPPATGRRWVDLMIADGHLTEDFGGEILLGAGRRDDIRESLRTLMRNPAPLEHRVAS